MKKFLPILFLSSFLVFFISSPGRTPYDYFTRLAASLLEGRFYLTDNPPWLSELITLTPGKFTFVNPPLPALLALPFVAVFGESFEQQTLAQILAALSVVVAYRLSFLITQNKKTALWAALAWGMGSIIWFLASVGSVWYLGQVSAATFTFLALLAIVKNKPNSFLIGFWISLACLSRTQLLLALPVFAYMLWQKNKNIKSVAVFAAASSLGVSASLGYNWLRFGDPTEFGHALIPGLIHEPWFYKGLFNLSYIPNHLKVFILGLPKFTPEPPYVLPTLMGMSVLLTSPWLLLAFFARLKNTMVAPIWIGLLAIALVNFSYGSLGISQFGHRYAVDFYPFAFLLVNLSLPKNLKWWHWLLLIISITVNLWGVVFINKLSLIG